MELEVPAMVGLWEEILVALLKFKGRKMLLRCAGLVPLRGVLLVGMIGYGRLVLLLAAAQSWGGQRSEIHRAAALMKDLKKSSRPSAVGGLVSSYGGRLLQGWWPQTFSRFRVNCCPGWLSD